MDQGHHRHSINHNEIVTFDGQSVMKLSTTLPFSSSNVAVDGQALIK